MYLDSCILVKLLAVEPDSDYFERSLRGQPLTSSELAYAEVLSALLARERTGKISAADRRRAWRQFLDWVETGEVRLEPLNFLVLRKSTHVLEHCHPQAPLRTMDAIHLATVEFSQDFPFATTDTRLRDAASLLGFELFPGAPSFPAN